MAGQPVDRRRRPPHDGAGQVEAAEERGAQNLGVTTTVPGQAVDRSRPIGSGERASVFVEALGTGRGQTEE